MQNSCHAKLIIYTIKVLKANREFIPVSLAMITGIVVELGASQSLSIHGVEIDS